MFAGRSLAVIGVAVGGLLDGQVVPGVGGQVKTEEDYPFYFGSDAPATEAGEGVINDEQAGTVRVRDGGQRRRRTVH